MEFDLEHIICLAKAGKAHCMCGELLPVMKDDESWAFACEECRGEPDRPDPNEWSYERKFEQFKKEIHDRFVKENEFWRQVHDKDIELSRAENPNFDRDCKQHGINLEYDGALEWDLYCNSTFELKEGMARVILGCSYVLRPEWCHFFEGTSVAWSGAGMHPEIIDGVPRIVLEILLIDYWTDEKETEWHKTHKWEPDHKYDMTSFFEDRLAITVT